MKTHFIGTRIISVILMCAMLSLTANAGHAAMHQLACGPSGTSAHDISSDHPCPCEPSEQHGEDAPCDSCVNCLCHSPLILAAFSFRYAPLVLDLKSPDTFKQFPEVYLPKFVPPQIPA